MSSIAKQRRYKNGHPTWLVRYKAMLCGGDEKIMIDFDAELKKFHPSLEIEDAEDAIYNHDVSDMMDLLLSIINGNKPQKNKS